MDTNDDGSIDRDKLPESVKELVDNMIERQTEVIEAIEARMGVPYADLVFKTATTCAVLGFCGPDGQKDAMLPRVQYGIECTINMGCILLGDIFPEFVTNDPLYMKAAEEFKTDVKAVTARCVGHVKLSDFDEEE